MMNRDAIDGATLEADGCASVEEEAAMHESRSGMYGLLSRLYRVEVDPLLLDQLRAMRFPAETGSSLMDEGYRLVATYVSNADSTSLTELAVDYVRTFIGHGIDAHSAAYPFESVYTSEKRLMMQEARDEVLAVYRSEGIDKSPTWHEGEDHVALELEFMKTMALRTAAALRDGDERAALRLLDVQRSFFDNHLNAWVPLMTADMRRFAKTDLYRGLASLTDGFLAMDASLFEEGAQ